MDDIGEQDAMVAVAVTPAILVLIQGKGVGILHVLWYLVSLQHRQRLLCSSGMIVFLQHITTSAGMLSFPGLCHW